LLSNIAKKFPIDVSVYNGMITELQGSPFGNLIVGFNGKTEFVNNALDYIRQQQVIVREVN
jgi:D-methionine transport system ATP-binding protein